MKERIKNLVLKHYPSFHKTTVFLTCSFLIVSMVGFEIVALPYLVGVAIFEFSDLV